MAAAHLPPINLAETVRHFAPGWFAAVMGSGVLSLDTLALASRWPVQRTTMSVRIPPP